MDINKLIKEAILNKNSLRLSALRAIKSAFILAQTEKGAKDLDDIARQKIILKQVKQRKDASVIYLEQNRKDLSDYELAQVEVLEEFLPKQLSEDDLDKEITAIIEELGASEIKDMGRVMGVASKKLSGKADNGRIAKIIKEKLNWAW